jgi:hypothetical protein
MGMHELDDTCCLGGFLQRLLEDAFEDVVPLLDAAAGVHGQDT